MGRAGAASTCWSRGPLAAGEVDGRRPHSMVADPHAPWEAAATPGCARRPPGWSKPRVVRRGGSRHHRDLMTSRYEVQVTGRLPQALAAAIANRFGEVVMRKQPGSTVLNGSIADQAALRSLLGLIWDTGCSVLAVTVDHDAAS